MSTFDPSIILQGRQFDPVGALNFGAEAAFRGNEMEQQNALRQFLAQNGAGVMSGDEAAMAGFARFDPIAAADLMRQRELQARDAQRFEMEQARFARDMAPEEPDEAAFMEGVLRGALVEYQRGDKKSVAAWFAQNGIDPAAIPYEMVPTLAAQFGVADPGDFAPQSGFSADRYRNVEGIGLVDLQAQGGPAPVQFAPGSVPQQPTDFATSSNLRKEINANPVVQTFIDTSASYNRMQASYNIADESIAAGVEPPAAGDIALIFAYMKMLDPGSTVREGEFATAQQAGSVPQSIVNMYNQIVNGQRLSHSQRQDFLRQAQGVYEGQHSQFEQVINDYSGVAQRYNIPIEDVIIGYGAGQVNLPAIGAAQPQAAAINAQVAPTMPTVGSVASPLPLPGPQPSAPIPIGVTQAPTVNELSMMGAVPASQFMPPAAQGQAQQPQAQAQEITPDVVMQMPIEELVSVDPRTLSREAKVAMVARLSEFNAEGQ